MITASELAELMAIMRAHGCTQLRAGDVAIVLGPAPVTVTQHPPAGGAAEGALYGATPHLERELTPDEAAIRKYRAWLEGRVAQVPQ